MRTVLGLMFGLWAGAVVAAQLPFDTAEARYETVAREQVYDAVLEAVNQSTVSAQTSGRVVELNFDVDDYVEKGSVIVRIRDKEQRAAVKAAEARYQEAQSEFKRIANLVDRNLVSQSEYDKAEAALKSAQASLDQAREQLERTVVRAPYSGIVVERHIELGETANPGQPLMTGLSLEHLRAVASVPEAHIATVRELGRARVMLPNQSDSGLQAEDLTISPYADPRSHTFKVRVNLPRGQHGVYPGMFAKVAFVTGERKRLLIPSAAVAYRSEVRAVYVIQEGGRISFRQIRVGRNVDDGRIEVLAGLNEGERVALDPVAAGVALKEARDGDDS